MTLLARSSHLDMVVAHARNADGNGPCSIYELAWIFDVWIQPSPGAKLLVLDRHIVIDSTLSEAAFRRELKRGIALFLLRENGFPTSKRSVAYVASRIVDYQADASRERRFAVRQINSALEVSLA